MKILDFIKRLFFRERILFADLDGTLIVTASGETFPKDTHDWQFKPYIISALRGYDPTALHIVSNQGGIEKGFVDHNEFVEKMKTICSRLSDALPKTKITFDYCTSNDPDDFRRKPNPGMIEYYVHDYIDGTDCDKRNCLMIGDASGKKGQFSNSDKMCAENAGVKYLDVEEFINENLYGCDYCKRFDLPCYAEEIAYCVLR